MALFFGVCFSYMLHCTSKSSPNSPKFNKKTCNRDLQKRIMHCKNFQSVIIARYFYEVKNNNLENQNEIISRGIHCAVYHI